MGRDWHLTPEDLKRYPHFDKYLPPHEAEAIATDPRRVASNPFFPFLLYIKSWRPYRPNEESAKRRPIRYACRRDAYIFARYRHLLNEKYEAELHRLKIQDCPIAYRKISVEEGARSGKCNIDFAKDAFQQIRATETCAVVALDISSYFENIDHALLYRLWCRLIGVADLPPDHKAVFQAITRYAVVDRTEVYKRLGFIGLKVTGERSCKGYLRSYRDIPTQLCTTKEFRQKIAGGDPSFPTIIVTNAEAHGIPQGAPISDILANIYLLDFDKMMADYTQALGGFYCRYSDDILIIIPGDASCGLRARDYGMAEIMNFGPNIQIKPEKTSVLTFKPSGLGHLVSELIEGEQGRNGFEYLGFRFDGREVYLRDSTLSGFYRKVTYSLRHEVRAFVARYPGKDLHFLMKKFDIEKFAGKFGRIEDFDLNSDYKDWTFWTYARRAAREFGSQGLPIYRQMSRHREVIAKRLKDEFEIALS